VVSWLLRVAAWLSQTVNLFLLFGHHDQTVSARCYVNRHRQPWTWAYYAVNALFFWQDDHCRISHEQDVAFAKEILTYESTDNPN
jgi:hypothetical protein